MRDPQQYRADDGGTELDGLFAAARAAVHSGPGVDVDRAVAVAAARAEARRTRRLAALRAVGLGLVLALLAGWVVVAEPRGSDVLMALVVFVLPAVTVFRWHLEAVDGHGLLPRRTPPTVPGWSNEVVRRVADLDRSVAELEQLSSRLDAVLAALTARVGEAAVPRSVRTALTVHAESGRSDARVLAQRLRGCSADSVGFVRTCASNPDRVDWTLLRAVEPGGVRDRVERISTALGALAALAPTLPLHDPDPAEAALVVAARDIQLDASRILPVVVTRSTKAVRAMDRLHRVAAIRSVRRETGPVAAVVGPLAVVAGGWRRSVAQRAVIRNVLVGQVPAGPLDWARAVARARTIAATDVVALGGGP